jgi:AcrR family transcriptional regulator
MGRPPHSDGRKTRQTILDAALDLFAAKGYFGTSLREIAVAVGVRESALYHYFPSKEALFEALIVAEQEERVERITNLLQAPIGNVATTLEELTAFLLDGFAAPRQEQVFRMLMTDGVRLAKQGRINLLDRLSAKYLRMRDFMRRLISEGKVRDADPELLAIAFIGPLLFWRHLNAIRPEDPAVLDRGAFARGHVAQFLQGAAVGRPKARVPRKVRTMTRRHDHPVARTGGRGRL